jgi:hypothetical protein
MRSTGLFIITGLVLVTAGCGRVNNFGGDAAFLQRYTDVILLSDSDANAQVAVVPQYQGRVMTSTAGGNKGPSYGWLNYGAISSGKIQPHINAYGGEERFWMGPEGGQFAIFFEKGVPFDFESWQTPALIDTEPFDLVSKDNRKAVFTKKAEFTNYSGTEFDIKIDRTIQLLGKKRVNQLLKTTIPNSVDMVAFATDNSITNTGDKPWKKETGLLSIWLLCMLKHSPETTVVIPFKTGPENRLGPKVNDEYFGKVPAERLIVKDNVLFFCGDGQYRSKIGINPHRAKAVLGSYDATQNLLTIVHYNKPKGITDYVNSMWELQDEPYAGDTVNSYNDGPNESGSIMGPFYELETSSPALELEPGQKVRHIQRTIHLTGPVEELDKIAKATLGVSIEEITTAIPK